MIAKRFLIWGTAVLITVMSTGRLGVAQQAPKALSIVHNDSTGKLTFEYRNSDGWQKADVEAKQDANIRGDSVRIATSRQDKATITVELPIEGGKKYVLFWNDPPGMWDFKGAS